MKTVMKTTDKITIEKIIKIWFGPETQESREFVKKNTYVWGAMQQVSETWLAPSRRTNGYYTIADKKDFAQRVKALL